MIGFRTKTSQALPATPIPQPRIGKIGQKIASGVAIAQTATSTALTST